MSPKERERGLEGSPRYLCGLSSALLDAAPLPAPLPLQNKNLLYRSDTSADHAPPQDGETSLHRAVCKKNDEALSALIAAKADIEAKIKVCQS
jgi:hypothetical protein